MSNSRKSDQKVEAFSASKELLKKATARAAKLGLTKSGYFRYALALELGHSMSEALAIGEHRQVTATKESVSAYPEHQTDNPILNDSEAASLLPNPSLTDKVKKIADKLTASSAAAAKNQKKRKSA